MGEFKVHKNHFQIHIKTSFDNSFWLNFLNRNLFALANLNFDFRILFLRTDTLSAWSIHLLGYLSIFFRKETKLLHVSAERNLALFMLIILLLLWGLLQEAWLIIIVYFLIGILSCKNRRCKNIIIFIWVQFFFL